MKHEIDGNRKMNDKKQIQKNKLCSRYGEEKVSLSFHNQIFNKKRITPIY